MSTTTNDDAIVVAHLWIVFLLSVCVVWLLVFCCYGCFFICYLNNYDLKCDFNFFFCFVVVVVVFFYTGTTTCPTLRARVENPLLPSGPIGVRTKFSLLFILIRKLLLRDRGDVPYSFIDAFENLRS